jgi:hypothetical protein
MKEAHSRQEAEKLEQTRLDKERREQEETALLTDEIERVK